MCSICGGAAFTRRRVLWPELVADWQLSQDEVDYVDDQQGCSCDACGANLRAVALGKAVQGALGTEEPVKDIVKRARFRDVRILDLNGAPALSPALADLPNYVRGDYPEVDMHQLPFKEATFDIVLHSDTLEHVAHPVRALEECRRILAPKGRLCFTIPIIVGRLSRSREGLPPSYHGNPSVSEQDLLVRTEFGADAWCYVMRAGFTHLTINHVAFPAATALSAWFEAAAV